MAAVASSRPFLLLDDRAVYDELSDWGMVECESKVAYGCGPLGQQIVEGLTLLADLRGVVPCLAVHATDEILGRLEEEVPGVLAMMLGRSLSEIHDEMLEIYGTKVRLSAGVLAVDDDRGLVVFDVSFCHDDRAFRSYYLVYDREAASLCLLPYRPMHYEAAYARRPLLVRRHGGGYSLVLMAVETEQQDGNEHGRPVLCLWTPSPDADGGVGPWQIRQRRHDTAMPARFDTELKVFSYRGKAFWADLTQGILYCECADLLNDCDDAPAVEFTFVALPEEYTTDRLDLRRAMGVGVGNTVWFVVLESCDHPGDTTVVVLSLDLSDGAAERRWERYLELSLLSIWALDGFKAAGLPRRVPWSPFLREQDAGVLYFLLPPADEKSDDGCHLIGIDARDSSLPRLMAPRRLAVVPWVFNDQSLLLDADFFDRQRNQEETVGQP